MKTNKLRQLTGSALMLALLIALQAATKPLGNQLITGTCVNAVLALTVLLVSLGGGLSVAVLSPVFAFLLGIAPQAVTVPAIMVGNCVYVALLWALSGKQLWRSILAVAAAAAAKAGVLYVLVVKIICGVASGDLLGKFLPGMDKPLLAPPMLKMLPAMFSWPQLITALLGGAAALALWPVLKKALKR